MQGATRHAWDGSELLVPETHEDRVDAIFERLEEEIGPFPIVLETDAESTEFNLDECLSEPCRNDGACTDGNNSFTCECAPGWMGPTCELVDRCIADNPCANGARKTNLHPSQPRERARWHWWGRQSMHADRSPTSVIFQYPAPRATDWGQPKWGSQKRNCVGFSVPSFY